MTSKKKPASRKPSSDVMMDIEGLNLSEEEKAGILSSAGMGHSMGVKPVIDSPDKKMVSQKAYDDKVEELNGKIKELKERLDKLKAEKDNIRKERDDFQSRFDKKRDELEELGATCDQLRATIREKDEKISELKGSLKERASETKVVRDETEINRLTEQVNGLKAAMKELGESKELLETQVAELQAQNTSMKESLESPNDAVEEAAVVETPIEEPVGGSVTRTSPTEFESDLFTAPKYLVRLARSGRTITFKPDVEGAAVCNEGRMRLPRLEKLVPFGGAETYDAVLKGNEIVVVLD